MVCFHCDCARLKILCMCATSRLITKRFGGGATDLIRCLRLCEVEVGCTVAISFELEDKVFKSHGGICLGPKVVLKFIRI